MKSNARNNLPNKLIRNLLIMILGQMVSNTLIAGPKYIPVVNGQFTTGQWYFEGEESSLSGNARLTFVPALRFSNKFSLLPMIQSSYRGTRSTEELAGGANLFQDTWENGIEVKAVHGLTNRWKLRERIGARTKWFRETTDESFGDGLYDYRIYTIGTEIERRFFKEVKVALGYEFSLLQFPNYVSLESNQSNDLAREFAGKDALDNQIHLISMRVGSPLTWKLKSQFQLFLSPRFYTDQTVVDRSGLLTSEKRRDNYTGGFFSVERPFSTSKHSSLIVNLNTGYTSLDSNQNHYDARLTTFVTDFFDYDQMTAGTSLTYALGKGRSGPMTFETGFSYSKRNYRHRVIQSSDGAFLSEKLHTTETNFTLGFSYPLSRHIRARTSSTFGRSKSNNDYEAIYQYNYNNANYQFGFTYDY